MFLSGIFLGVSSFSSKLSPPTKQEYSSIKVYGHATIDKLNITNTELTNTELLAIDITDDLVWDITTNLALAEFEDNLNAGNITSLSTPLTSWEIMRREVGGTTLTSLSDVDDAIITFTDYLAQANKNYEYLIYPKTATEIGQAIQSSAILADFYGVYLIDEDSETVLFFDLDIVTDSIINENDVTEYETYTKYNAYSFGDRDFLRGTIQATGGYVNTTTGALVYDETYFEGLRTIINNKTDKILKLRNGQILRVITSDFNYKLMDSISSQPYTIRFNFAEVGEV